MPQEIETAFEQAGISLFPAKTQDVTTVCSYPDYSNPCKHIAAVYYLLGEQFDHDPFLIFTLRGRTREQVIEAMRARRAAAAGEGGEDAAAVEVLPPAPWLNEQIETFWGGDSFDWKPLISSPPRSTRLSCAA
jgi:uncharacterized Zn finger protein